MGKDNEVFDGLVVLKNSRYEFYPGLKDCPPRGRPYWIVPNHHFNDIVRTSSNVEHLEGLFHGAWRVRLRGNLSHIGRYGHAGKYWRELSPTYVIDTVSLDCKDVVSE
jgi:hypothetical protein